MACSCKEISFCCVLSSCWDFARLRTSCANSSIGPPTNGATPTLPGVNSNACGDTLSSSPRHAPSAPTSLRRFDSPALPRRRLCPEAESPSWANWSTRLWIWRSSVCCVPNCLRISFRSSLMGPLFPGMALANELVRGGGAGATDGFVGRLFRARPPSRWCFISSSHSAATKASSNWGGAPDTGSCIKSTSLRPTPARIRSTQSCHSGQVSSATFSASRVSSISSQKSSVKAFLTPKIRLDGAKRASMPRKFPAQ
mmetsp:Transcript_67212/g.179204  ORF Transcript_67212/g.179204 Transcript_67212/m.179204 type:complete len:255 (-) Transcript_67212:514-1278(-)